jgi:hypothetical protein
MGQSLPTETERCRDSNRKATILIEHIIQASDVAHTMQHWHVYTQMERKALSGIVSRLSE